MEKLFNKYLVLTILILDTCFLYSNFIKFISVKVKKIDENNYSRLFKSHSVDNQVKLHKNPIQLHFYPILQFASKSTFVQ